MANRAIFSICTPSHIGQASVFFNSLNDADPQNRSNIDRYLFVVGAPADFSLDESFCDKIIRAESVTSPQFIEKLSTQYTPAELCWSLKPVMFRKILEKYESALYFDTDIWFTGKIADIFTDFCDSDILLTPHYLEPFNHQTPFGVKALSLLRGGVFNAGFIGVRRGTQGISFLDWWASQVIRYGRNDPDKGMCGDQRWLDLVPALYPSCKISRHPGMNVGYWNLHERHIDLTQGQLTANGHELIFIHFSGFDPERPESFSTHLPAFKAQEPLLSIVLSYNAALKKSSALDKNIYIYKKWWHKQVKFYRRIRDAYRNPRDQFSS